MADFTQLTLDFGVKVNIQELPFLKFQEFFKGFTSIPRPQFSCNLGTGIIVHPT